MRTRVRYAADIEGDTERFPDAQLNTLINDAAKEVWEEITGWNPEYFATSSDTVTVAGTPTVTVPATALDVLGVAVQHNSSSWIWCDRGTLAEIYDYNTDDWWRAGPTAPRYVLIGQTIHFYPTPSAATPVRVHFVPVCTTLADGPPAVDFDGVNGWDQAIVYKAALACMAQDTDVEAVQIIAAQLSQQMTRIERLVLPRDLSGPAKVSQVRKRRTRRAFR